MLAPYLFGGELELAAAMCAWERLWTISISNVVGTLLKSLCTSLANDRILLQSVTPLRYDSQSMDSGIRSSVPCSLISLPPSSMFDVVAPDSLLMVANAAAYDFLGDWLLLVLAVL